MAVWRRSVHGLGALASIALIAAAGGATGAAPSGPAGSQGTADAGLHYRLVDTWTNAPWSLTAGRIGHVADVSAALDGTVFVLDSVHGAVHVFSSSGAPLRVFRVPPIDAAPSPCSPLRLDAEPDGRVAILGSCGSSRANAGDGASSVGYVLHMRPDGGVSEATVLSLTYNDVAVGPDGMIYLARMWPVAEPTPVPGEEVASLPGGIDVVDGTGRVVGRIEHEALFYPIGVDVDGDGAMYVANRVPSPWDYEQPGPQPTAPPALLRATQEGASVEGIVIFDPDRTYRRTVPFTAPEDVAVGASAAFVSRNVEVFRVGQSEPLYSGPTGQIVASFSDGFILHLAVPARGGLLAGMAHCYFQGLLIFDRSATAGVEPRLVGRLDRPELRGPTLPARIDVGDDLALLQDRFQYEGDGAERTYYAGPDAREPQAVQRWSLDGRLVDQLGVCSGSTSVWLPDRGSAFWTVDVAVDGAAAYTVDRDLLKRWSGPLPDWSLWPGAHAQPGTRSHLVAASADRGNVAVLDVGTVSLLVARSDGSIVARWPLDSDGSNALPGDIALVGDTVFVADTAQDRVRRYTLDGTPMGIWPTHDEPWRIVAGPGGDLIVLGRRGWLMHYDADGELLASWSIPDSGAQALDVAVDPSGRVYVAYVRRAPVAPGAERGTVVALEGAGIWVFEPMAYPVATRPIPGACWSAAEKTVAPTNVRLGDEAIVTMSVAGACPGGAIPAQVVLVVDTSRSMNWNEAVDRARQVSLAVLAAMDPRAVDVGLVTFDDEGVLRVPLTREHGRVASAITAIEAWGDSHLAAGLATAVAELESDRAAAGSRQVILVVTDGEYTDVAREVALRARAAGIHIMAVAFPHGALPGVIDSLTAVAGDLTRVLVDPDPEAAIRLARTLGGYREEPGLFRTVEVADRIPGNMRYVPGSAVPEPRLDGDTLRWSFGEVTASAGLQIRYALEPVELGPWPTSVEAAADHVDALGNEGRLVFPVPRVYVWDRSSLTERAYLPYGAQSADSRADTSVDGHVWSAAGAVVVPGVHAMSLPRSDGGISVFLPLAARPPAMQQFASDLDAARARYPNISGTRLSHCRLCHEMDERFKMNPYGRDYKVHERDFAAIEPLDSDGDGFSNLREILALTFPGRVDSRPAAP